VSPERAAPLSASDVAGGAHRVKAAETNARRSLLQSFGPAIFFENRSWGQLGEILRNESGGSFGLSGPRGVGKTWLMHRAVAWATEANGLGVWFPSPSEYEATAFLAAISDVTAIAFEKFHDDKTRRQSRLAQRRYLGLSLVAYLLLATGALVAFGGTLELDFSRLLLTGLGGVIGLLGVVAGLFAFRALQSGRSGLGRIRQRAEEIRRQVRYVTTRRESLESGIEGGKGLIATVRRSTEQELVERPSTLSSLVHNFRSFAEDLAREIDGPVVVAIDELDKMTDPAKVAELLRDVKGILDVSGVHFLVSISDEAARSLDLGAIRVRNEFNSSFYTVIAVDTLEPAQATLLLRHRDSSFDDAAARVIGVLMGGIPREIVRVAELAQASEPGQTVDLGLAANTIVREEAKSLRDEILARANSRPDILTDEDLVDLFQRLTELATKEVTQVGWLSDLSTWKPREAASRWRSDLGREWQKLLVRCALAAWILQNPSSLQDERAFDLQGISQATSHSAVVGRQLYLGLNRRVPSVLEGQSELTRFLQRVVHWITGD
jgi:hypothetical protein